MKKQHLLLPILLLFLTFGMQAQNKSKAKSLSKEMTEVLSLDKKESKAIYKLHLNKLNESDAIKKEFANKPEMKKQKLKKLGNKVYNQIKEAIGIERLKKWKNYKSNN
jgi:hypothetical protein